MTKNISTITIDGTSYTTRPYCECTTGASTAAKTVEYKGFSLAAGAILLIKFTYGNTVAGATIKVTYDTGKATNSIPIFNNGSAITAATSWAAGSIVEFYYDGTNWNILSMNVPAANNTTTQGIVSTGAQTFGGEKTFSSKTKHNAGIDTTTLAVSSTSTFTGKTTHNGGITVPSNKNIEVGSAYIKYNSTTGCLEISC